MIYLLFAGEDYYPQRAPLNFVGAYESEKAAMEALDSDYAPPSTFSGLWARVVQFDGHEMRTVRWAEDICKPRDHPHHFKGWQWRDKPDPWST